MDMAAILFNGAGPFEQIGNTLSIKGPMWDLVRTAQAVSEKTTLQIWPCCKKVKGQLMAIIWTNLVVFESLMLYTEIQPQSFLGSREEDFLQFLPYTDMVAILQNHLTNWQYPFDRKPHVISGENCSSSFRKKTFKKLHNSIHVYSPGARADNPQGTKVWLKLKCFTTLITHCKFQPLVFNTFWENYFSTFSPYKLMGTQTWPCCKNIRGQNMAIIWTNVVDLESLMLYTMI